MKNRVTGKIAEAIREEEVDLRHNEPAQELCEEVRLLTAEAREGLLEQALAVSNEKCNGLVLRLNAQTEELTQQAKIESNETVHTEIERIKKLLTDESLYFDIYDDKTVRMLVEYIRVQGDESIVIMLKGGIMIEEKVL